MTITESFIQTLIADPETMTLEMLTVTNTKTQFPYQIFAIHNHVDPAIVHDIGTTLVCANVHFMINVVIARYRANTYCRALNSN